MHRVPALVLLHMVMLNRALLVLCVVDSLLLGISACTHELQRGCMMDTCLSHAYSWTACYRHSVAACCNGVCCAATVLAA